MPTDKIFSLLNVIIWLIFILKTSKKIIMSFFDILKGSNNSKPPNLNKPLFYKAGSDAKNQLEQLKNSIKIALSKDK